MCKLPKADWCVDMFLFFVGRSPSGRAFRFKSSLCCGLSPAIPNAFLPHPPRLRYVSFCAEILAATGGCVITAQRKHSGCPCFMYLRYIAQMQPWLSHPDNALWRHRSAALTYAPKGLEPDVKICPEWNTKLLKVVYTKNSICWLSVKNKGQPDIRPPFYVIKVYFHKIQ